MTTQQPLTNLIRKVLQQIFVFFNPISLPAIILADKVRPPYAFEKPQIHFRYLSFHDCFHSVFRESLVIFCSR